MRLTPARTVFGLALTGSGACALIFRHLDQLNGLPQTTLTPIVAGIEILAGAAILWPRTCRPGALVIAVLYTGFAALAVPPILHQPLVYNGYGNFFEQFSIICGALLLSALPRTPLARIAFYGFALCLVSFALEQYAYLNATAGLVPGWIPPGQRFWAIATTLFFALAGLALLTGIQARLAAHLAAAMLFGFALLTWVPVLVHSPRGFFNWAETFETLAIAATALLAARFAIPRGRLSLV